MKNAQYLFKQVRILDSASSYHDKVVDLLISNGKISDIGSNLEVGEAEEIKGENLHLSLGFVDLRANFNDPGNEDREDIESGAAAALEGGYTSVALSPATHPPVDSKSAVEYLRSKSNQTGINILPIASFSKGLKGEELSELYDMRKAGAVAFNHGSTAITNSALMRLALLYNRELETPLQLMSMDPAMAAGGQMHEGVKSTWLGLKGIPDLAETLSISRDIALAEYTGAALHFNGVSSAAGLKLIETAQAKGLAISGDVNLLNLIRTDADLDTYDSNLKLYPPLREESDRQALIKGLKSGILKGIASDHRPRTIEEKRCEFDLAHFGAATLEGSFAALNTYLQKDLGLAKIVDLLTHGAREILHYQKDDSIEIGKAVDLCLFNPEEKWLWNDYSAKSKAANYPFKDLEFRGKILGTFSKGVFRKREA